MKYRTDFVTNSSSTSFGAAGISVLLSLLASLGINCADTGQAEAEEEEPGELSMQKTVMPEGANTIVAGSEEPVWLYAQVIRQTKDGPVVVQSVTPHITFDISTGAGWITLGETMVEGDSDWLAVPVYGITPDSAGAAPESVSVKAKARVRKKTFSVSYTFAYQAEPTLKISPEKAHFLSGFEESAEIRILVTNPGPEPWELTLELNSTAEKICTASLEDVAETGVKATLLVTEADTVERTGRFSDQYDRGEIKIRAVSGERELVETVAVYVWREGLYLVTEALDIDRETGEVIVYADKGKSGELEVTEFDLRFMRWDGATRRLISDSARLEEALDLGEPEGLGEAAENLLAACDLLIAYKGVRPSNLPSAIYTVRMDKVVPGRRGETYRARVDAFVESDDAEIFEVRIPFQIRPAYLSEGRESWNKEYEACQRIINEFLPEGRRPEKLAQLEKNKHYMGAEDLKRFRHEVWEIAQQAILEERDSYLNDAVWYDQMVTAAEWTAWIGDRAFGVAIGTLTGPVGAYCGTQIKEGLVDLIVKLQESPEGQSWFDFACDYAYSRAQGLVGGAIDTKATDVELGANKETLKWAGYFYLYKFAWHWWFDKNEAGEPKGVLEAAKAAAWDVAGVGLEKAIEPFVKEAAKKQGYAQNEKLDEWVKSQVARIRQAINDAATSGLA